MNWLCSHRDLWCVESGNRCREKRVGHGCGDDTLGGGHITAGGMVIRWGESSPTKCFIVSSQELEKLAHDA